MPENSALVGSYLTNNGTVNVRNATVRFTRTLKNNGGYIRDPSAQTPGNNSVGANGYIRRRQVMCSMWE